MEAQERKHFEEVMSELSPVFGPLIQKAVLGALRQHHKDTGADKLLELSVERMGQAAQPTQPSDEQIIGLVGEFDAVKWAREFKRVFPKSDEGVMLGWFANAIMAGYDHAKKEERKKLKSMQDGLNIQGSSGNWDADYYMHGMFNGMEHMMAIMEEREPQFRSWPGEKQVQPTTTEVPGEREVWAQAYAKTYGWVEATESYNRANDNSEKRNDRAAHYADQAVKAFRERYK